jgi:hypothetical protein
VVVHNFNLMRAVFMPDKAYPPLIVNANAMLPLAGFEVVSWWNPKARQLGRSVQLQELASRHPFDVSEPGNDLALEKRLGLRTCE